MTILISFWGQSSKAQVSKYQALYITNFTKYINWSDAQVTIGVIGNTPVLLELEKKANQSARKFKIIKISGEAGIEDCDMIYIPEAQARNFSLIQNKIGDKPIIIISETEALLDLGAEIAFFSEGSKLRFSINKSALDESRVQVSNALLGQAKIVN